jgi:hypothetical protein
MDYPVRDQWGRPGIKLPGDSTVTYCTRASTVGKALDDMNALMRWKERMVAGGAGLRPDILAKIQARWPIPDDKKVKAEVDGFCEELKEAAQASYGANMGDALHAAFHRYVTKGEARAIAPLDKDLAAIVACLEEYKLEVSPMLAEQTIVITSLDENIAGTFDAIVRRGDTQFILDLKTGQNLDLSWGSFAVQLAIYAHGETIYDWDTQTHSPMVPVHQSVGLALHAPAGTGTATLYKLDLDAGWRAVKAALWVRAWTKRKDLATVARKP